MLLFHAAVSSADTKDLKTFLLEDSPNNQWCAFQNEARWKLMVQKTRAFNVGTLVYTSGRLSLIKFTQSDESGDWIIYDIYFVDPSGKIVKLSRTINVTPSDVSEVRIFMIRNGKFRNIRDTAKELTTGKPKTPNSVDWLPELPIATKIEALPFAALVSVATPATNIREHCAKTSPADQ